MSAGSEATALVALWITLLGDVLETVGQAVATCLIPDRRADAHVAADQIAVQPPHANRAHARRMAHRHGIAAANRIHDLIANHAAAGLEIGTGPSAKPLANAKAHQDGGMTTDRPAAQMEVGLSGCFMV